jgi:hypothetical protein
VHSQLVAKIERIERATRPAKTAPARTRADRARDLARGPFADEGDGEVPDVPEFIPRR